MKRAFIYTLVLAALTSCGGGKEGDSDEPKRELREAKGKFEYRGKKEKINYGGIFRMNEVDEFKTLHPHAIIDAVSFRVSGPVYQGLLRLNQASLEVEPCIAESFEVSEDATKYTFKIRKGIKFHDDDCFPEGKGREVTAHDVKYCFDLLCTSYPDNKLFKLFKNRIKGATEHYSASEKGSAPKEGVSGIKATDDYTLEVEMEIPFAIFDKVLTHSACWIFPKEAVEKYKDEFRVNPVGTGPFQKKRIKEGQQVLYERNANYWERDEHGNQLPYMDMVKFNFTKEKKTELMEFKKGNLDMVFKLPIEETGAVLASLEEAQQGANKEYQFQLRKALSNQFYVFSHTSDIFRNINVRKAFNYAIDRKILVTYTMQGEGSPSEHGLIPGFGKYDETKITGYNFDPELARKHLTQAGYGSGKSFPQISLYINEGGATHVILASAVQKMLEDNLGIKIKIETLQMPVLTERMMTGKLDFHRAGWTADYPDPENFFAVFYGKSVPADVETPSFPNFSRFKNDNYDKYFELALSEKDENQRYEYFYKCDSILIAEAAYMPIYNEEYIRLLQLNVRNFPQNSMEYRDLSRVFFAR
ncbi:MAG: ABC transporter substrate-binding protein [Flavobacteriales bacterium]